MRSIIFSGSPRYCAKRLSELTARGWRVTARRCWSDGKLTYTLTFGN